MPDAGDDARIYRVDQLQSITSVLHDIQLFSCEKWEIASDSQGSGNTANIGSITKIEDILNGKGTFSGLGEEWFDQYWMNYGKISIPLPGGRVKKITKLKEFIAFKGLVAAEAPAADNAD